MDRMTPHRCTNWFAVVGLDEDVAAFRSRMVPSGADAVVPHHDEPLAGALVDLVRSTANDGSGATRTDFSEIVTLHTDGDDGVSATSVRFVTPDAPPSAAVLAVAKRFRNLSFVHAHATPEQDDGGALYHRNGRVESDDVIDPEIMDPYAYDVAVEEAWRTKAEGLFGDMLERAIADVSWDPAPARSSQP